MSNRDSPEIRKTRSTSSRGRWSLSGLWNGEGVNGPSTNGKGPNVPKRSTSLSSTNGRPTLLRSHSSGISRPELIKRTASGTGFTYRDPDSSDEETDYVPDYIPPSLQRKMTANSGSTRGDNGSVRPPLERTRSLTQQNFQNNHRSSSGTHLSRTRSIDSNSTVLGRPSSSSGLSDSRQDSVSKLYQKWELERRSRSRYNSPDISRSSSRNGLNPPSESSRSVSRGRLNTSSRSGISSYRESSLERAEIRKRQTEELRIATREDMEKAFGKFRINPRLKDFVGRQSPNPSRVASPLGFQRSNSRSNNLQSDNLNGLPSITESSPIKPSFPN
ncbi:uncharacterized protein MELLADRAFT_111745 [Melampsora larici-populina 98AG31]|uniref:Uncharacterized protein n=1 Tax=Melampsora larici-populina (strain 98AG31 / pathotype 3-4-7) TaxID=747676 RepID=F4S434_MELLP|nr:uncharacterized protein MELLADRAFT_111745 [Melampsora larici-populina 98AG31]EGG00515.1 hypothetical protein MELLADRAFT_111745 [Melampsora larici-populina 98AG31]